MSAHEPTTHANDNRTGGRLRGGGVDLRGNPISEEIIRFAWRNDETIAAQNRSTQRSDFIGGPISAETGFTQMQDVQCVLAFVVAARLAVDEYKQWQICA